ncbi:unnamed protein product, partial [Dicrocoelium dendriticum]
MPSRTIIQTVIRPTVRYSSFFCYIGAFRECAQLSNFILSEYNKATFGLICKTTL